MSKTKKATEPTPYIVAINSDGTQEYVSGFSITRHAGGVSDYEVDITDTIDFAAHLNMNQAHAIADALREGMKLKKGERDKVTIASLRGIKFSAPEIEVKNSK